MWQGLCAECSESTYAVPFKQIKDLKKIVEAIFYSIYFNDNAPLEIELEFSKKTYKRIIRSLGIDLRNYLPEFSYERYSWGVSFSAGDKARRIKEKAIDLIKFFVGLYEVKSLELEDMDSLHMKFYLNPPLKILDKDPGIEILLDYLRENYLESEYSSDLYMDLIEPRIPTEPGIFAIFEDSDVYRCTLDISGSKLGEGKTVVEKKYVPGLMKIYGDDFHALTLTIRWYGHEYSYYCIKRALQSKGLKFYPTPL